MNELATIETQAKEVAIRWLDNMGIGKALNKEQKDTFIEICSAYQLNPFKREIWGVKYKDDFNIIVGYETYLKRAERTGKLDGYDVAFTGSVKTKVVDSYGKQKTIIDPSSDLCAKLTIHRKDWSHPFTHEVYISEFSGQSPIWVKSPRFMLKKVALSQGFRLCFPDDMGGLPYTSEEYETFKPEIVECEVVLEKPSTETISQANKLLNLMRGDNQIYFSEAVPMAIKDGDKAELERLIRRMETAVQEQKPKPEPKPKPRSDSALGVESVDNLRSQIKLLVQAMNACAIDGFDTGARITNSYKKHLGGKPSECEDTGSLAAYRDHLLEKCGESLKQVFVSAVPFLPDCSAEEWRAALNDADAEDLPGMLRGMASEVANG